MTAYFAVIWKFFIVEPVSGIYVHRSGALVFFSWFLLAKVGLNLSKYSVAGIEAALLMEPRWAPMSAAQLMDHGNHSWSGPSGWLHLMKNSIPPRVFLASGMSLGSVRKHRPCVWPSKAWFILSLLGILPFLAIPLSGLAVQLRNEYIPSTSHPVVSGRTHENFNQ